MANPSGLLLAAVMMLIHIGQNEPAQLIHNAWLSTIEDGIHTADISSPSNTKVTVTTPEFGNAVCARLGRTPKILKPVEYSGETEAKTEIPKIENKVQNKAKKTIVGVDVFLHWSSGAPSCLGEKLTQCNTEMLKLLMITNRGVKVWPEGLPETFCTDHWRCRFMSEKEIKHEHIIQLLSNITKHELDFIKCENLCNFDNDPGYSLGQGQ
jgi:isocitrate dehydrogenase